jgi:copper chaperone
MTNKFLKINGMTCGHCVKSVEVELKKLPLENIKVEIGQAEISYDENKVKEEEIKRAVVEAGYEITEIK